MRTSIWRVFSRKERMCLRRRFLSWVVTYERKIRLERRREERQGEKGESG